VYRIDGKWHYEDDGKIVDIFAYGRAVEETDHPLHATPLVRLTDAGMWQVYHYGEYVDWTTMRYLFRGIFETEKTETNQGRFECRYCKDRGLVRVRWQRNGEQHQGIMACVCDLGKKKHAKGVTKAEWYPGRPGLQAEDVFGNPCDVQAAMF
jgi:hypothetical protein